jgi:hypothetical protein
MDAGSFFLPIGPRPRAGGCPVGGKEGMVRGLSGVRPARRAGHGG